MRISFGVWLKQRRFDAGLTIEQVAEKSGLTARALRYYEADERIPSLDASNKIAKALGISVEMMARRMT